MAACSQTTPPAPVAEQPPLVTLPEMGQLSGFTFSDHTGGVFGSEKMRGRIWVVDFIYTTCQAACPRMSKEMYQVQQSLAPGDDSVGLLSITVDPDHDTREVLAAFAARYKADPVRWKFLTGDKAVIRKLQKEASVDMDPEQLEQSHNKCLVLVDTEGFIRGSYKSDPPETDQLLADLAMLKRNPARPQPADALN